MDLRSLFRTAGACAAVLVITSPVQAEVMTEGGGAPLALSPTWSSIAEQAHWSLSGLSGPQLPITSAWTLDSAPSATSGGELLPMPTMVPRASFGGLMPGRPDALLEQEDQDISPVPLPSALWLTASGVLVLLPWLRRQRRRFSGAAL